MQEKEPIRVKVVRVGYYSVLYDISLCSEFDEIKFKYFIERIQSGEQIFMRDIKKWCESGELTSPKYQRLGELDKKVSDMDAELSSHVDAKTGMPEKTVQMYFTIYYADEDQMQKMQGKITIGEGYGGIVGQLKMQNEMKLTDESWLSYQQSKGEESFQAYMADLTDMREHVLPYLQSFCSLEERAPDSNEPVLAGNEKSMVKKAIEKPEKVGKDSVQKGVELT